MSRSARKFVLLACLAALSVLAAVAEGQPTKVAEPAKDELADERAKLQKQLADLLKRVEAAPAPTGPGSQGKPPSAKKPDPSEKPLDPLRAGMNRFRVDELESALWAFRNAAESNVLTREDHAFAKYMEACCLRKLNKTGEAITIYREVADAREDEFVAELAIWQLSLLRSSQELELQIEQLRVRPKTR